MTDFRQGPPISTYRLQLSPGFTFADARDVVPYLVQLGVTACYSSPHLEARPGSAHGYDICDHSRVRTELGGESGYHAFADALAEAGLGHIVDVVPNHMAADPLANRWWRDVLENGPSSRFSDYFDIDWDPVKPELKGRVLLPVLGDQYGLALEGGALRVRFDTGTLVLLAGDLNLPLNPRQLPRVLDPAVLGPDPALSDADDKMPEFQSILTSLANLPPYTERDPRRIAERHREKDIARDRLARLAGRSPRIAAHLDACITRLNGTAGDPASFDALHDLLERQAYRLAYWRTAFDEINYRRFFDVNGLVALRMEEAEVFDATHATLARHLADNRVTGVRVDHPDGLFDPKVYLDRLQALARQARGAPVSADGAPAPLYVIVEKILSHGESLQDDWPVAGTTGYDFLTSVAGLFVDGRQAQRLRRIYARLTGQQASFEEVAYQGKRTIALTSMASEMNVLAHDLNRLSEADRRYRDFTLDSCRKALREVLACCPVYRTYLTERGASAFDRGVIEAAIEEARRRNPVMEESIFRFLREMLLPEAPAAPEVARARLRFAMKLQQVSGPLQAKGVEDTAFYRYLVIIAANDVGGHPGRLGTTPAAFHEANARRLARHPWGMTTTATHDMKRGEDARVRLAAISEMAEDWRRGVAEWMRLNAGHRTRIGRTWAPDRNDEYLFYQALAGVWPPEPAGAPLPARADESLVERLDAYMQKAVREAKVHTSWIDQDQRYGRATGGYVRKTLAGPDAGRFLASFVPAARRLARVGAVNALSQLVLKIASPGVADTYQGAELWDLSLVDPDNRRPVDFGLRRRLLDGLEPLVARIDRGEPAGRDLEALLAAWTDGRIKLFLTALGLRFRRRHPDVIATGAYVPIAADGSAAEHVVAFARVNESGTLVAVAPRLVAGLLAERSLGLNLHSLRATSLRLPAEAAAARYRHLIAGESISPSVSKGVARLGLADVLRVSPVALLWSGK